MLNCRRQWQRRKLAKNNKSKEDKVKVTNLKNSPKFQIFEFWNWHYTRHTLGSCLIRCANMKWIRWVLLKIQSGHDSVHRRTDGQGDISIPPFQLRWSGGYNHAYWRPTSQWDSCCQMAPCLCRLKWFQTIQHLFTDIAATLLPISCFIYWHLFYLSTFGCEVEIVISSETAWRKYLGAIPSRISFYAGALLNLGLWSLRRRRLMDIGVTLL